MCNEAQEAPTQSRMPLAALPFHHHQDLSSHFASHTRSDAPVPPAPYLDCSKIISKHV